MPKDEAFSKAAAAIEAGLPDPFLMDFQLARRLVTNHIIVTQVTGGSDIGDAAVHEAEAFKTIGSDPIVFKMNGKRLAAGIVPLLEIVFVLQMH